MESINEAIENALYFISVVQNACDKKRVEIEQHSLQCYNTYLKEWKAEQKRIEKEMEKDLKSNYCSKEERKEASLLAEELEELALSDSLLKKARAIRNKNRVLTKQMEETSSSKPVVAGDKSSVVIAPYRRIHRMNMKTSKQKQIILPQNKTIHNSVFSKASTMPHSKSLNEPLMKKDSNVPNTCSNLKKYVNVECSVQPTYQTADILQVGLVSTKEFIEYKCMTANPKYPKTYQKTNDTAADGAIGTSDLPQNVFHQPALSYISFKNNLKSTFSLNSHFQAQIDGFWYPFINNENKKSLFEWTKCNTLGSLKKVLKMIYQIQEIMMWIDLLSQIGKEVFPILKFLDGNDKNVVRLCSYISSIYHESLQRIPLLSFD